MKHIILFIFAVTSVLAQPKIPDLKYFATDLTGTLNQNQISQLSRNLKAFEDSTSNQFLFLMIPSLSGYPLENYTYETAKKNKIGSEQHDNGILFFVAKNDRKMRIEVGYGLEGALPDALASSILRNEVRPYFKSGDYFKGIANGIISIEKAVKGEYKGSGETRSNKEGSKFPIMIIWLIIFIVSMFKRKGRGRRGAGIFFIGGGGSSGGFGGGGSFGGFSGGGGSFGGGGASGGW